MPGTATIWQLVPPFMPTDISGLQLWLAGDKITGLVDADPVSTWADQSGNAFDATSSGASRPTYKTGILNGLPVTRWSGGNFMQSNCPTDLKPFSAFAVVKITDFSGYRTISGASAFEGFHWRANVTSGNLNLDSDAAVGIGTASSPVPTNTWCLVGVTYSSSGGYEFFVNGASVGSGTNSVSFIAGRTMTIGNGSAGAQGLVGDMAEYTVYNSDLTTTNRQKLEAYLQAKWAI